MRDLSSIKLVFDDGTEQDFDRALLIIEDDNGLLFDSKSILPHKQVMYVAMILMELLDEYAEEESADFFRKPILSLINTIQNTTEGANLQ